VVALPASGAAELTVTALELSLRANGSCYPGMATGFQHMIAMVRRSPEAPAYELRLQAIEAACAAPTPGGPQPATPRPASQATDWPTPPPASVP
jgi:hypothetical protein